MIYFLKTSLRYQVTAGLMLILGICFFALGFYLVRDQETQLLQHLHDQGHQLTALLAKTSVEPIQRFSFFLLQEMALKVEESENIVFCEIMDEKGNSLVQINDIVNTSGNKDITPKKTRQSGQNILLIEQPIIADGQLLGKVEIGFYLDAVKREIGEKTWTLALIFLTVSIFLLVAANVFVSALLVNPVIRLAKTSKILAQGKFVSIETSARGDEIGELFQSFNEMSRNLSELYERLKESHHRLEIVLNTTYDLSMVRDKLEVMVIASKSLLYHLPLLPSSEVHLYFAVDAHSTSFRYSHFRLSVKPQDEHGETVDLQLLQEVTDPSFAETIPAFANLLKESKGDNTSSLVADTLFVPLWYGKTIVGMIEIHNINTDKFRTEDKTFVDTLSQSLSVSLDNVNFTYALEQANITLEKKVESRTLELTQKNEQLEHTLEQLKTVQNQLIQQEKMVSLGTLTAGIAHEIRNPLNFINNFADLSVELVQEAQDLLNKSNQQNPPLIHAQSQQEIQELLESLEKNARKIHQHGQRANSIVQGMLAHSRGKPGERRLTDLNGLLEESARLAYHGLRAQDSNFNINLKYSFDPKVGHIELVQQDVNRVFLNIINNACHAAYEKKILLGGAFNPTLSISTLKKEKEIEIRIRDNGNGIPEAIRSKIFDPFFTTKPTGVGTGLGLSISYDVIVQGHKGKLFCETKEGEFAEFIIILPC